MNMHEAKRIRLTEVMDVHTADLLSKPNVIGVGIGEKIKGGQRRVGLWSITVYVKAKVKLSMLSRTEVIPDVLETSHAAYPTDVIEVGSFDALGRTDKERPCPGGMSIGHRDITAGTFGCLVNDNVTGAHVILSNNHVLANSNMGKEGDAIYQPGTADGGSSDDRIAGLLRFVPIGFAEDSCPLTRLFVSAINSLLELIGSKSKLYSKRELENTVDCAIALPDNLEDVLPTILEIGAVKGVSHDVDIGRQLKKSGRTTELTTGTVLSIGTVVMVNYGGKNALFVDQIVSDVGSAGGDSGSVILDEDNNFVALLFAGGQGTTIGNPARSVLDSLDISIIQPVR